MPNLKCKICGTEFPPIRERHYISRDLTKTGLAAAFGSFDEPAMFDSYDCPCCESQVIAQLRKRQYDPKSEEATEEDLLADMSNETIAEHLGLNPETIGHLRAAQNSSSGAEILKHFNAIVDRFNDLGDTNALSDKEIYDYMHNKDLRPSEAAKDLNIPRERVIEAMDNVTNGRREKYPWMTHYIDITKKKPSTLYFPDANSAWAAVKVMRKFVVENGFISIADVDAILGGEHRIASRWGWTDLNNVRVVQPESRSDCYISFPAICDRPSKEEK